MSHATMAFISILGKVVVGAWRENVGGGEKTSVHGSTCWSGTEHSRELQGNVSAQESQASPDWDSAIDIPQLSKYYYSGRGWKLWNML